MCRHRSAATLRPCTPTGRFATPASLRLRHATSRRPVPVGLGPVHLSLRTLPALSCPVDRARSDQAVPGPDVRSRRPGAASPEAPSRCRTPAWQRWLRADNAVLSRCAPARRHDGSQRQPRYAFATLLLAGLKLRPPRPRPSPTLPQAPAGAVLSRWPSPVLSGPEQTFLTASGFVLQGPFSLPNAGQATPAPSRLRHAPLRERSAPLRRPVQPSLRPLPTLSLPASGPGPTEPLAGQNVSSSRPKAWPPQGLCSADCAGLSRRHLARRYGAAYRPEQTFRYRPRLALVAHRCNGSDAGPPGRLQPLLGRLRRQ